MSYDHWKLRSPDDELDLYPPDEKVERLDEINKRFERLSEHYARLLMAKQITQHVYDAGLRELNAWYETTLAEMEKRP